MNRLIFAAVGGTVILVAGLFATVEIQIGELKKANKEQAEVLCQKIKFDGEQLERINNLQKRMNVKDTKR